MGWAYSVDLRERVIAAFDAGDMTDEQVAAFFRIGEATVHRWKRLKRETGSLERRRGGGGNPPRVAPEKYDLVRTIVEAKPDATDQEVAWEFHRCTGQSVSRSSMNRVLLKLALTRKKKTLTATEQETPRIQELRRKFIEFARTLDPRRLVFLDEAGSHIAMTRDYARAPRGERAYANVPRNAGTVTTMIGALDLKGVRAMMSIEGATDTEVFETFLVRVLARKLRPGDIVVLDNVGAHKAPSVRRIIETAGARVLFLPPYSPDLNPIAFAWSKLKALLKEFGARTQAALDAAIRRAMDLIGADDAGAWFCHCGYGTLRA